MRTMDEPDNLRAAIAREASDDDKAVSRDVSADGSPADKTVLVRLTADDRERWKLAADKMGITMSQMIRDSVNKSVSELLDCSHPVNQRRFYPWAEFCLKCGLRLRG